MRYSKITVRRRVESGSYDPIEGPAVTTEQIFSGYAELQVGGLYRHLGDAQEAREADAAIFLPEDKAAAVDWVGSEVSTAEGTFKVSQVSAYDAMLLLVRVDSE